MRERHVLFVTIVALGGLLLLEAPSALAQKKGRDFGGGKFGGKFGGRDFKPDPGQIFDFFMSKGRGHFFVNEAMRDRDVLEAFAKKEKIADGKITKDQFLKYWEQRDKLREEIGGGGPQQSGGRGGGDPEAMFKRYDANGDGFLNATEIEQTKNFKHEWQKWDENKDGLISLTEWKAYMAARSAQRNDRKSGDGKTEEKSKDGDEKKDGDKKDGDKKDGDKKESITKIEIDDVEYTPPVVYRAGKLPKELPPWFTDLDTNKDGQVSLAEWMKGGKSAEEFARIDRNDDGLLTAEEVLRFQRLTVAAAPAAAGGPRPGGRPPRR